MTVADATPGSRALRRPRSHTRASAFMGTIRPLRRIVPYDSRKDLFTHTAAIDDEGSF
jgi:hypothetical protein